MSSRIVVVPDWPWNKAIGIAHAVRVGETVYVSGQVALDPDGNVVGKGNMYEQARQVFRNIEHVLGLAGGSMADIVKLNAYLIDFTRFAEYAKARHEVFGPELRFAATGVEISRLIYEDLMIEVEVVAEVGS